MRGRINLQEQGTGTNTPARPARLAAPARGRGPGLRVFRVQSLFELTNSKPTKLALKAVPSEQRGLRVGSSCGEGWRRRQWSWTA